MKGKGKKMVERMTEQMENCLILLEIHMLLSKGYHSIAYIKLPSKLCRDIQTDLLHWASGAETI